MPEHKISSHIEAARHPGNADCIGSGDAPAKLNTYSQKRRKLVPYTRKEYKFGQEVERQSLSLL